MYHLDCATVLRLVQEFRRNGLLQAKLPSGTLVSRESCWGKLEIVQGKIASCAITNSKDQILLTGKKAMDVLQASGQLDWTWEARQEFSPLALVQNSEQATSPIPVRITQVTPSELNSWPRQFRRVFVLIDGERSVNKITTILGLSGDQKEVMDILNKLQQMGKIILKK